VSCMEPQDVIGLVGAGIVGQAWALIFARKGCVVKLFDAFPGQSEKALQTLKSVRIPQMIRHGLITEAQATEVLARIEIQADLETCMTGVCYVQESVPEDVEIKRKALNQILSVIGPSVKAIGSSSSAIPMSEMCLDTRTLVAHPVNPPFSIPLVEVVPSSQTCQDSIDFAISLLRKVGQSPILINKEVPGFVLNRLQYALLAEAFRLVDDGVCSPEDVDLAVSAGLGRRWCFMGPFQTIDMNAPKGVEDYVERYGETILNIVRTQDNSRTWSSDLVSKVSAGARRMNGEIGDLSRKISWRDGRLLDLSLHLQQQQDFDNK